MSSSNTNTTSGSSSLHLPHKDFSQRHEIKWGIVGTGKIAHDFALAMKKALEQNFFLSINNIQPVLYAVASRNLQHSQKFAQDLNISKSYGSYEDLAADPEVDIVYISTPNHTHAEVSTLYL